MKVYVPCAYKTSLSNEGYLDLNSAIAVAVDYARRRGRISEDEIARFLKDPTYYSMGCAEIGVDEFYVVDAE